jgi:hypothetical protein
MTVKDKDGIREDIIIECCMKSVLLKQTVYFQNVIRSMQ